MAGAVAQDDDSGGSDAGVGDGGESPFGLNAAGRRLSGEHVTAEAKQQLLQQLRTEDEKTYDGSPETHKRPQHTPEDYGISRRPLPSRPRGSQPARRRRCRRTPR